MEELADRYFRRLVEPHVCWRDSGGLGFIGERSLDSSRIQHAPSKNLRMRVLTRDRRRCLICGRSPAHYVDVELHVHHAIPWMSILRDKYPEISTAYLDEIGKYQAWLNPVSEEMLLMERGQGSAGAAIRRCSIPASRAVARTRAACDRSCCIVSGSLPNGR